MSAYYDCDICDGTPAMHAQHNQATLNNGCVCDSGCDQCARLAEEWTELKNGCWIWPKSDNGHGYGRATRGPNDGRLAHRVVWEALNGAVPDGLQLDHICRTKHCIRPDHLRAVTAKENNAREDTVTTRNAAKTHCLRGHPFTPENTHKRRGMRNCRTCRNDRQREKRLLMSDEQLERIRKDARERERRRRATQIAARAALTLADKVSR